MRSGIVSDFSETLVRVHQSALLVPDAFSKRDRRDASEDVCTDDFEEVLRSVESPDAGMALLP